MATDILLGQTPLPTFSVTKYMYQIPNGDIIMENFCLRIIENATMFSHCI